jgi:serine phosphatase RsbU (regulator of sigma subunit)
MRDGARSCRNRSGSGITGVDRCRISAGPRYEHGDVTVKPGDLLVIFSDGIIEAADGDDEGSGEERLISAIGGKWQSSRQRCAKSSSR